MNSRGMDTVPIGTSTRLKYEEAVTPSTSTQQQQLPPQLPRSSIVNGLNSNPQIELFYKLKNQIDLINQQLYLQGNLLHVLLQHRRRNRLQRKGSNDSKDNRNYRYWHRKLSKLKKTQNDDLYNILYDLYRHLLTSNDCNKSEVESKNEGIVFSENDIEVNLTTNEIVENKGKITDNLIKSNLTPPVKTYPCPEYNCGFVGRCPAVLKIHKFVHNEEPLFQCQFCRKKLKSKRALISHALIAHKDQNIYFCDLEDCSESYSTSALLRKHKIEEHENLVAFECKKCQKYFKNVYGLDRHLATLHSTNIICDVSGCRRTFPTNIRLERHLIREHNIRRSAVNKYIQHATITSDSTNSKESGGKSGGKPKQQQSFQCCKCSRTFERGYLFKAHQKAVDCTKVFCCHVEDCPEMFHKIKLLTEHCLAVHQTQPKFRCTWPGCSYLATQNRGLKSHNRVHTGERPYQCDWPGCEKSFKTQSVLVGHRKQHKNERKYVCKWPDCDYKANTNCTMRSHIRLRHEKTLKRRKKVPIGPKEPNGTDPQ